MTLCIAARCCDKVQEMNTICCFDTRIETATTGAETGFKFRKVAKDWAAMLAGNVGRAEELIRMYTNHLADKDLNQKVVIDELRIPAQEFKRKLIDEYIQSMVGLSYADFLANGNNSLPTRVFENLGQDILQINIGCQLILIPIGICEEIFTVETDATLVMHNHFAAIGTGANSAYAWLHYRQQHQFSEVVHTLIHLAEAKKFSENAPGVGKRCYFEWIDHNRKVRTAVYSDKFADKVWTKFGPRKVTSTDVTAYFSPDDWDKTAIG